MPAKGKTSLCSPCRDTLPYVKTACKICALPLVGANNTLICGECINQKSYVDYAFNLFHYMNPVVYLINQMKFQKQLSVTAVLADLLKTGLEGYVKENGLPEAIIPVPLHKKRLIKRGFNQSLEIIRPYAKSSKIPIITDIVERSEETQAQTQLNKEQRKRNVASCFSLTREPDMSHIVIVDDVVTTGATTQELAKTFKHMGIDKIGVWSLARAELH